MKISVEGTEKQIQPIVQMLQGFGVLIADSEGNSLNNKKLSVNDNQDSIEQSEAITSNSGQITELELDGSKGNDDLPIEQNEDAELSKETVETKNKTKKK